MGEGQEDEKGGRYIADGLGILELLTGDLTELLATGLLDSVLRCGGLGWLWETNGMWSRRVMMSGTTVQGRV